MRLVKLGLLYVQRRPTGSVPNDEILRGVGMAKSLYTARAHVTGGREQGHGVTSDGVLDIQLRTPVEMGGDGKGTNPEQLFAIGYAACFEGALGVVGRRERTDLGAVAIDSEVSLITSENRGFNVSVVLDVSLPGISDPARAVSIVAAAHEVCPYSNATRGNVAVILKANGQPVPTPQTVRD
jgi:Ohr subfamily peroxiredoxin